ncbi:hypothetical protein [Novosphingobium pokkalii]|uniref:Uncharacterized protein n=1 Tax=Novosphingobium pokkalii TaxID=1770194 RepID=A0ABV7V3S8_9SPHN|nr:hypothetical protein [Novosphingobium pokkalii]GHC93141.1 hypothetical protein GCM10019060_19810 [Novosphingobium pokkalii]
MREGKPGRVFVAERLGAGDYAAGAALFDAKLAEARAGWLRMDRWKSVAALAVVIVAAVLAVAVLALLGRAWIWWAVVVLPLLALLFVAVLCRASVEAFARFGRPPNGVAWLVPEWLAKAMMRQFALYHIDSGDVFVGFAARQVIAVAGGVELDPRLFSDRLWPLFMSPDDHDRSRATCREYGYRGAEITVEEIALPAEPLLEASALKATADLRHPFQRVPYQSRAEWIGECLKRKGYAAGSYRHSLLQAVLVAVWEEMNAPEWHGRKLNNAEVARRTHNRVVRNGQGFRSTELNEGKASDEPADWVQKMIAGRSVEYRFAVDAAGDLGGGVV